METYETQFEKLNAAKRILELDLLYDICKGGGDSLLDRILIYCKNTGLYDDEVLGSLLYSDIRDVFEEILNSEGDSKNEAEI